MLDGKRKKFKEDLEAREEAYKRSLDPTYNSKSDEERLKVWQLKKKIFFVIPFRFSLIHI